MKRTESPSGWAPVIRKVLRASVGVPPLGAVRRKSIRQNQENPTDDPGSSPAKDMLIEPSQQLAGMPPMAGGRRHRWGPASTTFHAGLAIL